MLIELQIIQVVGRIRKLAIVNGNEVKIQKKKLIVLALFIIFSF